MNGLRSLLSVVSVGALAMLGLACGSAPTDGDDVVSSSSEGALKVRTGVDGTFTGTDGNPVRFRSYDYKGKEKAIVVFLHGRGEFVEKYDVLFSTEHEYPKGKVPGAETLANMPVSFVAIDHEGQGDSKAGRIAGHVDNFEYFVNDIDLLFQAVPKLAEHKVPILLVGHSMGGLIAARFAQDHKGMIDGLVLSSPMLKHFAPAGLTADQLSMVAGFWAAPEAWGGQNRPTLCTQPLDPQGNPIPAAYLAAIALLYSDNYGKQCFADSTLPFCGPQFFPLAMLTGDPAHASVPMPWATLEQLRLYLTYMAPAGCAPSTTDTCPDLTLTTDNGYCNYYYTSPRRAPAATFGWLFTSFLSQKTYWTGPQLEVPVLLLTNGDDKVVDSSVHGCFGPVAGDCEVAAFPGFGHELLSSADRREPIAKIKEFISSHIGE